MEWSSKGPTSANTRLCAPAEAEGSDGSMMGVGPEVESGQGVLGSKIPFLGTKLLVVENNVEKRTVNLQPTPAVIVDET